MSVRQIATFRFAGGLPALLLAVLALVSQVALGATVLSDAAAAPDQSISALTALTVLCDSHAPAEPAHHHRAPDAAMCPLSVALALPAVLPASGPDLPVPQSRVAGFADMPGEARAPPGQTRVAPPPRGPPALS